MYIIITIRVTHACELWPRLRTCVSLGRCANGDVSRNPVPVQFTTYW